MSKLPPIPPQQRAFSADKPRDRLNSAEPDRRDEAVGVQSPEPGDADVTTDTEGRLGNLHQNLTPRRSVQDR